MFWGVRPPPCRANYVPKELGWLTSVTRYGISEGSLVGYSAPGRKSSQVRHASTPTSTQAAGTGPDFKAAKGGQRWSGGPVSVGSAPVFSDWLVGARSKAWVACVETLPYLQGAAPV